MVKYSTKRRHILPYFIIISATYLLLSAQSVRIATYNILNFPEAMGMQRTDDLRDILEYMDPDILVVQEMQSQAGVALFLDSVLNYYDDAYIAAPFHDGPDTDNALFYRSDKAALMTASYLTTVNRDIMQYNILLTEPHEELIIFSLHLKASQGPENEAIRLQEATILRNHLDTLSQDTPFIVAGDFNIYTSTEPAYAMLTDIATSGQLFDPLDAPGEWHENSDFAYIHTQSSRVQQLPDGGAGGGLDDRFDMLLCSSGLLDSSGLYLPAQTYTVHGNDGNHFNDPVNQGYNQSVPSYVAHALYYASDHLPVSIDIIHGTMNQDEQEVVKIYPNPMQTSAHIQLPWFDDFQSADVAITNIIGQRVFSCTHYSPQAILLDRGSLPVGVYFVHIRVYTHFSTHSYTTKLAVIE
jgi:endonuclease/exonuclease/phosphatase family metal-dependent hydrolase